MKFDAVFLDRDGVLNPHIPGGYLLSERDVTLMPGVASAIRRLNDAGLPVIVISNQQGVGKGLMTQDDLFAIEARMAAMLKDEAGAHIDKGYYCTDLAHVQSLRRKPQPGMLTEAAADFRLTLARTAFLGDSPTDIQAGHAAGVGASILLLSGGTNTMKAALIDPPPDHIFADLPAAVEWILGDKA